MSQVPAEARCARACGALSSVLGPSAWTPTPLAVGWALAVSSSSLGLPCSPPHVLLRPGPGVGLWGGWQAAARAVPRGSPGSAHVLGALGPLESPRGMASRAGCSSCHPKELLRLTEAVVGSVLVGRAVPVPGLCLDSACSPLHGTLAQQEGPSTSSRSAVDYFATSLSIQCVKTQGKETNPTSRCCWRLIPTLTLPCGIRAIGAEAVVCHFMPGAIC